MTFYQLPSSLRKYFWDVDVKQLNIGVHKDYVIERILEFGDLKAFRWLNSVFDSSQIIRVIMNSKQISIKSANFYSLYFKLNLKEVLCLQKDFQDKHRIFWYS